MARGSAHKKASGLESGVCVLCGSEAEGAPAKKDAAISLARKMRSLFGMGVHHSVACKNCLPLALEKRQRFERSLKSYRMYSVAFILLVVGGSVAFRSLDLRIAIPGAIGAAIIMLLPYGYYFPAFEITEKK